MKEDRVFVDTNVLVYAYDRTAGKKHDAARDILLELWKSGTGILSTQVLQEFFVNITRKIPHPLPVPQARVIVSDLLRWTLVVTTGELILEAIDLHTKHKLSFWDSMIVAAAILEDADTIFSEDLQDGLVVNGVTIRNPFVSSTG